MLPISFLFLLLLFIFLKVRVKLALLNSYIAAARIKFLQYSCKPIKPYRKRGKYYILKLLSNCISNLAVRQSLECFRQFYILRQVLLYSRRNCIYNHRFLYSRRNCIYNHEVLILQKELYLQP